MDNRIENLEVLTHQQHAAHHNQKHALTKSCVECGVEFTPKPTKLARGRSPLFHARAFGCMALKSPTARWGSSTRTRSARFAVGARAAENVSVRIADDFGIDRSMASAVARGKCWKWVA